MQTQTIHVVQLIWPCCELNPLCGSVLHTAGLGNGPYPVSEAVLKDNTPLMHNTCSRPASYNLEGRYYHYELG
jgi:hypothetical protein